MRAETLSLFLQLLRPAHLSMRLTLPVPCGQVNRLTCMSGWPPGPLLCSGHEAGPTTTAQSCGGIWRSTASL